MAKIFKAVGDKLSIPEIVALLQSQPDYEIDKLTFGKRMKIEKVLRQLADRYHIEIIGA